jgi:NitT/TauT family transport system ATP-binding protein
VELKHLHDKSGRTTVFVTHSIREAVFLADRVVVLKNGRLEAVVDTRAEGRITAYTDGLEARLRDLLGQGDSTRVQGGTVRKAIPWELWASLALIAVVLLIWQGIAVQLANPFLLPSPLEVITSLVQNFKMLFLALLVTLETALTGLFFGALIGTVLGYVLGRFVWLERILSPFLIASQNTPTVILAPLLLNYLGFTFLPGVIVTVIICFYPILVSTTVGLREVEREYQELFRTLGASSWQRLKLLELPGALPVVLGGLRLGVNLSLIGSVVWEFVNPNVQGIGLAVTQAQVHYDNAQAFAAVFLLVLSGCAGYGLLTWLERLALRHRRQN